MAPPFLNPPTPGMGQPQQSLPNMNSPFAQQNPSQSTNPFMGSGNNSNNASNSPFAGAGTAGFKNPFGSEHGSNGNPFGGGTAGGGVKGLIESNNKLIQALNKLTAIFEKLSQKMGQGGMGGGMGGGVGGMGGGMGGMGGVDPLQAAQMRRLAAGGMGGSVGGNARTNPFTNNQMPYQAGTPDFNQGVGAGAGAFNRTLGGSGNPNMPFADDAARNRYMMSRGLAQQGQELAYQQGYNNEPMTGQGLSPAHHEAMAEAHRQGQAQQAAHAQEFARQAYNRSQVLQQARTNVLNNVPGLGTARDFLGYNLPEGSSTGTRMANAGGMLMRGAGSTMASSFNLGTNIGSTGTMAGMLSQIPYIGGLLAIPYTTLGNRINQFAPMESMARLVAQQGGIGQGGNFIATHRAMFDKFQLLGLDPGAALQEALTMQEASGVLTGMDPMNIMGSRLSAFVASGFTGQTVGSFQRLNRKDRMLQFDPQTIFEHGLSLGLGDQGQMELLGAFEGIQNMVPGMGFRGNAARVLGQVANNTNNGFIGVQGVLQAQRQIQGSAEAGRGLKGIFGGLLETMTTADMLMRSGGDISKAIRMFEDGFATDPSALKGALTGRFGKSVTEMGFLASMTSADYDNIGQGELAKGQLAAPDLADIVLSKTLVGQQIARGDDLYKNRLDPAQKLLDFDAKLEQQIINGVSTAVLDNVGQPLLDLAKNMQDMAKNLSSLLGFVIKGVDLLAQLLKKLTSGWPF